MGNIEKKYGVNINGKFYVDDSCIGCTICAEIAPDHFRENTDENLFAGHAYVYRQPVDTKEERLCAEALDICPTNAIGDDGSE